jgi:hypothetical protein
MSPTYWAASQIKMAAETNGWKFIKHDMPDLKSHWGCAKPGRKVMVQQRKDGGLVAAWFTYPVSGGVNIDYLGPRYKGKLRAVLRFLEGLDHMSVP